MSFARPSVRSSCFGRAAIQRGLALAIGGMLAITLSVIAQTATGHSQATSKATKDRLQDLPWWPTKGTPPLSAYAGTAACNECHSAEATTQVHTPMALASSKIGRLKIERRPSSPGPATLKVEAKSLQSGSYLYRINTDANTSGVNLSVRAGNRTASADIPWIMGAGVHGQTYILETGGNYYESQVSSFAGLKDLDITPGHLPIEPGDLEHALGERLSTANAARCFGCHSTYSSTNSKFDISNAVPGVHCEACHGPGAEHIKAINAGEFDTAVKAILNPAILPPADSVDFCGACHRTAVDVVESEVSYGPMNVRFQPYRLEKSRCWGSSGDTRLTCIACHNPHQPLVKDASRYDRQCLACHTATQAEGVTESRAEAAPAVCPKASVNCVTCHMPKYEVPGMHARFTDHFIRVVAPGEPYPN